MIISLIPKSEVPALWPVAGPLIERAWAEAPGYYRAIDILDHILQDKECLWGVFDEDLNMIACFTTQIELYPLSRKLVISSLAGEKIKLWYPDMMEIMQRFARDQGCSDIIARGREGWKGIGKNSRWRQVSATYEYPVEKEQSDA